MYHKAIPLQYYTSVLLIFLLNLWVISDLETLDLWVSHAYKSVSNK